MFGKSRLSAVGNVLIQTKGASSNHSLFTILMLKALWLMALYQLFLRMRLSRFQTQSAYKSSRMD